MYGAQGWVLHHNTDQWRITGPVDHAATGLWPMGGAWLCRHLWEHYLYTGWLSAPASRLNTAAPDAAARLMPV